MTARSPLRATLGRFVVLVGLATLFVGLPTPIVSFESVASAQTVGLPRLLPSDGSELARAARHGPAASGAQRLKGRVTGGREFSMIGVSMAGAAVGPIMIRVRDTRGDWGEWREVSSGVDEGPDAGSREAASSTGSWSEPIWVGSADGYELSIPAGDAGSAEVVVVREETQRVVVDATPLADAAYQPFPGLNPRSAWSARAPRNPVNAAPAVLFGVVHHSASSNSYTQGQVPALLRSTQAYHMDDPSHRWDDIGYNFIVDKFGGIWEGRARSIESAAIGAHAAGFNTGSVGVMVLGDYISTQSTAAANESVAKVLGWKMAQFGTSAAGTVTYTSGGSPRYPAGTVVTIPKVVGHRDVGSTQCPGSIWAGLTAIRNRTNDWASWWRATMAPEGQLEVVTGGSGQVSLSGWAVDGAAQGAAWIRASVSTVAGKAISLYTSLPRPSIAAEYGGDGAAGFAGTLTDVPPGMQSVCATVKGAAGIDTRIGCEWVLVTDPANKSPIGRFDAVVGTPGGIQVTGWALDPDSTGALSYQLLVDGVLRGTGVANEMGAVVPAAYTSSHGTARRFTARAGAVTAGRHFVCVKGINRSGTPGSDNLLDCGFVTVPGHTPGGMLESIGSSRTKKVDLTGWALDLESTSPVYIRIVIGNRSYVVAADRPRPDIAAKYPGYGDNHGFAVSVTADGGEQSYCITAVNIAGGSDGRIACGTIDVVK